MPPALPKFLAVYAFLYAAFGVQSPFLPALLREQGLHAEEIGIVLAASTAIRVLAGPAIGHAADRLHRHTSILCGCAIAAAVAGLGYLMMHGSRQLAGCGAAPCGDVGANRASVRCACNHCGARERVRWEAAIRLWMAACIRLRRIHCRHDRERLGSRESWPWCHDLVERGAARYRRYGGSAASEGSLADMPMGIDHRSLRDWALLLRLAVYRRVLIIAALVEGSHALHDAFSVIRMAISRHRLADRWASLVRIGVVGGGGLPTDWATDCATIRSWWRVRFGCWGWDCPVDSCGLHHRSGPVWALCSLCMG